MSASGLVRVVVLLACAALLELAGCSSRRQPTAVASAAGPYDFRAAEELLRQELRALDGHVAVILRQGARELFRFQAGDIGFDTRTRMASVSKTISAGVLLSLVDEGLIGLDERLGDLLPGFEENGLGAPTVTDCWGMRHGIEAWRPFQRVAGMSLERSVERIGARGSLAFEPGTRLAYDGKGMQCMGRVAELRTGESWPALARARIFEPCDMPRADYLQFAPNPAVPAGLRSSANELMNFAQMVIDGGAFQGQRVLSRASVERLFTNATRGLPVEDSPWPAQHALYPYGVDPDYGFGTWILAEEPATQHVEEIVGAGAWGSFLWIDRRRALTAVLVTDVRAGSQDSTDAALGLFAIAREVVEGAQVRELSATGGEGEVRLRWKLPAGASGARVYGAQRPIRDLFDLRQATLLATVGGEETAVPGAAYYAVTATFEDFENTALVPAGNAIGR